MPFREFGLFRGSKGPSRPVFEKMTYASECECECTLGLDATFS